MAYKGLQEFINILDKENELIRIKHFVDPDLEISEIVDRISKQPGGGKAILFENTGTDFPVLINAFGSIKRMCLSLGVDSLDELGEGIEDLMQKFTSTTPGLMNKLSMIPELNKLASLMPKVKRGKGKCQEVINADPNLFKLPILKCWPEDGGKFVTLPMVISKDPETGIRNIGMYRMQIFEKNLTGMHWHRHKVGARHYEEYKKRGEKMPIAVAIGGDPANTYSATAPIPDHIDEFILSGFLRKKKVELVKCITQDLEVPADADFIIEGYIDPKEELLYEGPFGDHTGFYSLPDYFPAFHITCITHRKDATYFATIVGIPPQEDAYIAKATERLFITPIKLAMLPEVIDMDIPQVGVAHNLSIIKINKSFPGHAQKVMNSLWGAGQMMFNKALVVVDGDVDIHEYKELTKHIFKSFDPVEDIVFSSGPLDELDHASDKAVYGGKIGIDATKKYSEENRSEITANKEVKFDFEERILSDFSMVFDINADLCKENIPILIIAIDKKDKSVKDIAEEIHSKSYLNGIKVAIFVDKDVEVNDLYFSLWIMLGNTDAGRDVAILNTVKSNNSTLIIDGTAKRLEKEKGKRDWPNIIIHKDETIEKIDSIWDKLSIGEFIKSPSLKYKPLVHNKGVVAGIKT